METNLEKEEIPKMWVDRVLTRKNGNLYIVIFELGTIHHEYVLNKKLAESLIKNLNRL